MFSPVQIMVLRMWRKGKTHRQIAVTLNITVDNARQRLHRALGRMRECGIDVDDWIAADEILHPD